MQKTIAHAVPTSDFPFDKSKAFGVNGLVKIPQAEANGSPSPRYKTLNNKGFLSGIIKLPAMNTPVRK